MSGCHGHTTWSVCARDLHGHTRWHARWAPPLLNHPLLYLCCVSLEANNFLPVCNLLASWLDAVLKSAPGRTVHFIETTVLRLNPALSQEAGPPLSSMLFYLGKMAAKGSGARGGHPFNNSYSCQWDSGLVFFLTLLIFDLSSLSISIILYFSHYSPHVETETFLLRNLIATYRLFCRFSILLNLDQKKKSVERQPKLPNRLLWLRQPPDGFLSGLQMSYDSSLPQWSPVTDVAQSFQLFVEVFPPVFKLCMPDWERHQRPS